MPKCETCRDFGNQNGDSYCHYLNCFTIPDFNTCPNHSDFRKNPTKGKIIFKTTPEKISNIPQTQTNFFHLINKET